MEPLLFFQHEQADEHLRWPEGGEVALHSSRSPVKTTDNEDAALVHRLEDGRLVLAVADGVGGLPAGQQASRRALEELARTLQGLAVGASLRETMLSGLDRANHAVLELGSGCATTIVAATVEGGQVRTYHVGDAGAVVFGGRGKVKLETIPHSPVGYGIEAGLISSEDAFGHEDRHLVSNVVGDVDMHIGLSSSLRLQPRDGVVLASDGLFDNVPVPQIVEALRRGPLEPATRKLATVCRARMTGGGHPDDLTLIAYRPTAAS